MNEFESLDQLNQVFKLGKFTLPDDIVVSGFGYHRSKAISYTIPELKAGRKCFVIYALNPADRNSNRWKQVSKLSADERPIHEWIICIWALDSTLSVRPARVSATTPARAQADLGSGNANLKEANQNIITDTVGIRFLQFNRDVPGKVDTGANLSSLHCEEWKVLSGKNMVEFRSSLLSDNVIRTDLIEQVAIQTSEGSEYRPVIALDIAINGKTLQNSKFNLNDRSQMQDKILVGQNILEKGRFLVDPNKEHNQYEGVDWDALQETYKDVTIIEESTEVNHKKIDELYDAMLNSDVTMSDLAHHILVTKEK